MEDFDLIECHVIKSELKSAEEQAITFIPVVEVHGGGKRVLRVHNGRYSRSKEWDAAGWCTLGIGGGGGRPAYTFHEKREFHVLYR
jgi:hypothetical protein